MKLLLRSMDKKIFNFRLQQEDADKKQTASDRKQLASNKKIASLEKGYNTMSAELSLLKIRLNSEMQVEPSVSTSSAKKPSELVNLPRESTVQLNSLATAAQSEDAATDDEKRAASSYSDEAEKDEDSSSEDDDFEAIQKVLGNKK